MVHDLPLSAHSGHPGKRLDGEFDFVGYRHTRAGLVPARDTVRRFHPRLTRFYEQGADPLVKLLVVESNCALWTAKGLNAQHISLETASDARPRPSAGSDLGRSGHIFDLHSKVRRHMRSTHGHDPIFN